MERILLKVDSIKKKLINKNNAFLLESITFDLHFGEIIALVGLNGAGKTTLLKIIVGLLELDSGSLIFNSRNDFFPKNKIGYLPENFSSCKYDISVFSFLKLFANLSGIKKGNIENEIIVKLQAVGMIENKLKKIKTLSKGMKTRLGLAQALLNDPLLLILDEPMDGLDPMGRLQVKDYLLKLKQQGKTILISSHILSEIQGLCDRIIVLHRGRLLNSAKINEILKLNKSESKELKNNLDKSSSGNKIIDNDALEELFYNLINANS